MAQRPAGVPHTLSWVRRVDDLPWERGLPPEWGLTPTSELPARELALELARCAVDCDISVATAARLLGVGRDRARRAMDQLRDEAAPRRGRGYGPLSDSGIYKRLRRARRRSGRTCLAPGCDNPISPQKRLGTYACSGTCRKRIFDAGGRDAVIARMKQDERDRKLAEQEARRQAKLPPASPLIRRCAYCDETFTGPLAAEEFKLHSCQGRDLPTVIADAAGSRGSPGQRVGGNHTERTPRTVGRSSEDGEADRSTA